MFTTVEEVDTLTGYTVENATIHMAQSIVEAYIGKVEVEVSDANDLALLAKATAYQAAYMVNDAARVFEQISAQQIMQFGQMMTFRADQPESPFVAPLAIMACRKLSWKRLRSVKTGSIFTNYRTGGGSEWSRD